MAATGHASEEISGLFDTDVEFLPDGVALTLSKKRANSVKRRQFSSGDPDEAVVHPPGSRLDAADLLRRLIALASPAATRAGLSSPFPLSRSNGLTEPEAPGTRVCLPESFGWKRWRCATPATASAWRCR